MQNFMFENPTKIIFGKGSISRIGAEVKRRTRAVGAFPDRASALRLVTAVALQVTAIWTDRRYLDMSLLKPKEVIEAKAA